MFEGALPRWNRCNTTRVWRDWWRTRSPLQVYWHFLAVTQTSLKGFVSSSLVKRIHLSFACCSDWLFGDTSCRRDAGRRQLRNNGNTTGPFQFETRTLIASQTANYNTGETFPSYHGVNTIGYPVISCFIFPTPPNQKKPLEATVCFSIEHVPVRHGKRCDAIFICQLFLARSVSVPKEYKFLIKSADKRTNQTFFEILDIPSLWSKYKTLI